MPDSLQGQSLVAGKMASAAEETAYSEDEEVIVRERLQGLGYIE